MKIQDFLPCFVKERTTGTIINFEMDLSQIEFLGGYSDFSWNKSGIWYKEVMNEGSSFSMGYLASGSLGPPPAIRGITWMKSNGVITRWISDQLFRYKLRSLSFSNFLLNLEVVENELFGCGLVPKMISVSELTVDGNCRICYRGSCVVGTYGTRNFELLFNDGFVYCWGFSHKTLPGIGGITWEFKAGNDCVFKSNERFSIDSLGALRRIS